MDWERLEDAEVAFAATKKHFYLSFHKFPENKSSINLTMTYLENKSLTYLERDLIQFNLILQCQVILL